MKQKLPLLEIALFFVLVLSLFAARFLTFQRTSVKLGKAIELPYTGLSIHMPEGNGWESHRSWRYKSNHFVLGGIFSQGIEVQVRYAIVSVEAEDFLKRRLEAFGGKKVEEGRMNWRGGTLNWVHFRAEQKLLEVFAGAADLGDGRQLQVEVTQMLYGPSSGWKAFEEIVNSAEYERSELIDRGNYLVKSLKREGVSKLIGGGSLESYYIISNAGGSRVGFMMDVLGCGVEGEEYEIQASSLLYLRTNFARESKAFFRSSDDFEAFEWHSESSGVINSNTTEVWFLDGVLHVKQMGREGAMNFRLGDGAVAEVFVELVIKAFYESDQEEVLIDIVESDGTVSPCLLSKAGERKIKCEFLNRPGASEEIEVNEGGKIVKRYLPREKIILELSSLDELLEGFSERREIILRSRSSVIGEKI
jgi:hypothetical protein